MNWRLVSFVLAMAASADTASAQNFNQYIGFGDSTIDSGWWKAWLASGNTTGNPTKDTLIKNSIAQGGTGAPVGAGYQMNNQILASYFSLSANPADQPGGTNYAISGSVNAAVPANGNIGNLNPNPQLSSTAQQMTNYLAAVGGAANPNALYQISSGGNDATFALDNIVGRSAQEKYVGGQAANLTSAIQGLQSAGARYIIVHDDDGLGTLSSFYNRTLWTDLSAAGVQFIPSDVQAMRRAVVSNPAAFGLTTVAPGVPGLGTGSACVWTGAGPQAGWAQWCVNSTTPSTSVAYLRTANAQQTSLFADDQHFSAAGQRIEADYDRSLIVAPSEISYLAEAPVKTRAAVINAIDSQIPISLGQPGAYHTWVSGDVSSLKMSNANPGFPDDPGTPLAATAGFDFRLTPNWLAGFAVSGGRTKQSYSLGGDFTLNEFAISGYAAYKNGPLWGNTVASAGGLFFDSNRQVPIGITTQSNTGSTKGSNFSLLLETGYNFRSPLGTMPVAPMPVKAAPAALSVEHGPVVGLTLQQVHVNGFTETDQFANVGGFTALSFLSQTRNSAVSELGYQASVDLGAWRPFGKLVWNHELADTDRQVTALLTSASFAPGFSLPAVTVGKDWGTAQLGTTYKLSQNATAFAAFNTQLAQQNVTTYGGQVGVNVSFDPEVRDKVR
jgi:outer membrane lipase/esterase